MAEAAEVDCTSRPLLDSQGCVHVIICPTLRRRERPPPARGRRPRPAGRLAGRDASSTSAAASAGLCCACSDAAARPSVSTSFVAICCRRNGTWPAWSPRRASSRGTAAGSRSQTRRSISWPARRRWSTAADANLVLRELARVLRPGGRLVVSVPDTLPELVAYRFYDLYRDDPFGHRRIYTRRRLVRAVRGGRVAGVRAAPAQLGRSGVLDAAVPARRLPLHAALGGGRSQSLARPVE